MDNITEQTVQSEIEQLIGEAANDPEAAAVDQQIAERDQQNAAEWKEIIEQIAGPAFQVLAPGWNIQPVEVATLAEAYAGLLNKYLPDGPGNIGPELGAALVTVAIIGPRLKMPRKLPAAANDPAPDKPGEAANDDQY